METNAEKYTFNFFVDSPQEIKERNQQMMRKLLDSMVEMDWTEIDKLLKESKATRYSIQGYEEDVEVPKDIKEKLISAGYASALIDAMQLYVEKINTQNEIYKINTKYRDVILRILAKRGTLLHGDLASALGVSPSGLNAIIKQMNGTTVKLISVEEISKYKLYSITPVAYKYIMRQEQEHLPRKDNTISKYGIDGYVLASKYKERPAFVDLNIECRDIEELKRIEVLHKITHTNQKYGERVVANTQILKFEKKLA